jgi:phosphoglycolate phosphatase
VLRTPAPELVLFDLDGTLSDSAAGILAALRHAFAVTGLPPLDPATERAILGPPFYESLPPLIGDVPLASVISAYRAHYGDGGMFDTSVFPGVVELLAAIGEHGVTMAVATSKPEAYAIPIVEHLGLTDYFVTVGGDALDGSLGSKALVVGDVLARVGHPDPSSVLMIGDRSHDVAGARVHRIDCVGVAWGYALPGELAAARPVAICATPAELAALLGLEDLDAAAC